MEETKELRITYEIVTAIWKLCKKYGCKRLSCEEWEAFVEDAKVQREIFHQKGEDFDMLFRGLFMALQDFYIRKGTQ